MSGPDPRYPEPDDDDSSSGAGDDDEDDGAEAPFELFPPDVRDDLARPLLRLAGRLLDVVVDFVAASLVGALVERTVYGGGVAPLGVALVIVIGVPTLLEAAAIRLSGRTAGMAVFGMRVVRGDDGPLGWGPTLVRSGALWVLLPFFDLLAPFLVGSPVLFDPQRRGLHDRLAGTLVVRTARGREA